MEYLAKTFIQSHINGSVLIALQESHLKELGCDLVGDRLMLMEYIRVSLSLFSYTMDTMIKLTYV